MCQFLYLIEQSKAARLELPKQAETIGVEPAELLALKWLAEHLIVRKMAD